MKENMRLFRIWILFLSFLICGGSVFAMNYFIDKKHADASDENTGTLDKP